MRLEKLLNDQCQKQLHHPSLGEWDIESISSDSREVKRNSLFVALKGSNFNGADFIPEAVQKGARVIAASEDIKFSLPEENICLLRVDDSGYFLKEIVERFYGNPSKSVRTIGVTGTNGKTTITYLLESIFQHVNKRCAVMGTINYRMGNKVFPSRNTTPGLVENQTFLSQLAQEHFDYCAMEVSSHALDQGRVDLIDFAAAIFTNLTSDHLDYHLTRENYFQAKAKLFARLSSPAAAVINTDDAFGERLLAMTDARCISYGIKHNAQWMAEDIQLSLQGTGFKLIHPKGENFIQTPLVGIYNVYNTLAVMAACFAEGMDLESIQEGISFFRGVPGRLERVDAGQNFSIFIDYAHTQDALENILKTLRQVSPSKIILVFGCGGNRDKTKRPLMGRTAAQWADYCVVTSDNPREEDPQEIIDQILPGFQKDNYTVIVDRREAIGHALSLAREGDTVLIAGKGHEDYQVLKDKKIPFKEKEIVRECLQCLPR